MYEKCRGKTVELDELRDYALLQTPFSSADALLRELYKDKRIITHPLITVKRINWSGNEVKRVEFKESVIKDGILF